MIWQTVRRSLSNKTLVKILVIIGVVTPYLVFGGYLLNKQVERPTLLIASGSEGGLYFKLGAELANTLNNGFDGKLTFTNVTTHGSVDNTEKISRGEVQLALAQDGLQAEPNVAALAKLYNSPLHIVIAKASGIKSILDLKKTGPKTKAYIGADGSGTRTIAEIVLSQYGLSPSDLTVVGDDWSINHAADALMTGDISVAFLLVGYGAPAVERLANDKGGRFTLLGIDRLAGITTAHPYLEASVIPKASYPSALPFPDEDVHTLSTRELLICNSRMSERQAYKILSVLFSSSSKIVRHFTLLTQLSQIDDEHSFYYPLHPGAVSYYTREAEPPLITWQLAGGLVSYSITLWGLFHVA
jgi:uncharacterized protein